MRKICLPIVLLLLLDACQPTNECGAFTFTGSVQSSDGENSLPMNNSFSFTPATCKSQCTCETDCFIQMVHVFNYEEGTYEYIASYEQDRATADGWFVDRVSGYVWGYYGRLNDGTFASYWNPPGNNTTPTILYDGPARPTSYTNMLWEAVDVPVCIQSSTCTNSILGYYLWSWTVDNNGTPHNFIMANAWKGLDTEFQSAISAWNAWAPGAGDNVFPTMTDL
jgi:hypothetical protein